MTRRTVLSGLCTAFAVAAVALGQSQITQQEHPKKEGEKPAAKLKIGQEAPAFALKDSTGKERKLADHKGKIVVLEWFNTQCPVVEACYKNKVIQDAQQKVKELDKDIVWVAINTTYNTTADDNNAWIKKYGLTNPILLDTDGKVGRLYDARKTPHMYVIDKEGILRYQGAIDNNEARRKPPAEVVNYVVNAVTQIVNGETVEPDTTQAYGCTVKYKGG